MIFQRWAAARAFSHLCAFDPHLHERAELIAAGVGTEWIATLYGTPFSALTPALIEHLDHISDHQLLQIQPWTAEIASIFKELPYRLIEELKAATSSWPTGEASGDAELYAYLSQRFEPYKKQRDALMTHNSVWVLGDAFWHAHWLMNHRAELPRHVRGQADRLMLRVARMTQLSKSFEAAVDCGRAIRSTRRSK